MTYKISLSKLGNTRPIKKYWQINDSYCALGRVAVVAVDDPKFGCYIGDDTFMFDVNKEHFEFLKAVKAEVGEKRFQEYLEMNDAPGPIEDTCLTALSTILQELSSKGLIEIVA